jgi:hypothetical protein
MNFFRKILSFNTSPGSNFYSFQVKCDRCGEIIEGHVNLSNDLAAEYTQAGDVYFIRKVVMGNNKCFQRIEVELKFDPSRKLLEQHASGGQFV